MIGYVRSFTSGPLTFHIEGGCPCSVGASGSNVVRWAILPQVAPLLIGWTLYRFEINFRVSIVLGLVGAGGIGFFIQEKMGNGSYNQMVVAIIAIVIVVNIIDFASSYLRSRLV